MEVFRVELSGSGAPELLRLNPLRTERVEFNIYSFQPWQALPMHSHPESDEVFYVVDGHCLFYVEKEKRRVDTNQGVYVRSGARHAVLSCNGGATLISVQGPQPIRSIYGKGLEYFCPACGLETPLTTDTRAKDMRECPRCKAVLKLVEAGEAFDAEIVKTAPPEARA